MYGFIAPFLGPPAVTVDGPYPKCVVCGHLVPDVPKKLAREFKVICSDACDRDRCKDVVEHAQTLLPPPPPPKMTW